jgi:hypothetical protein
MVIHVWIIWFYDLSQSLTCMYYTAEWQESQTTATYNEHECRFRSESIANSAFASSRRSWTAWRHRDHISTTTIHQILFERSPHKARRQWPRIQATFPRNPTCWPG